MIRRDDDDGIVPFAAITQGGPHPIQLGVDLADHSEVLGLHPSHGCTVGGRGSFTAEQAVHQSMVLGRQWHRVRARGRVVHRRELTGRAVRRMRPEVREMGEPRLRLLAEPPEERVGEERRRRQLGRALVFDPQRGDRVGEVVAAAVQPLQPRELPAAHVEHRIEPGQHSFVRREPWIVGRGDRARVDTLVGVAEQCGHVSGAPGGPGDVVETSVERCAVGHDSVVHLVRARVQSGASRRAGRGLRVVPGQADAFAGELVEGGRVHHRMTCTRQAIGPELIERDQQDVRCCLVSAHPRQNTWVKLRRQALASVALVAAALLIDVVTPAVAPVAHADIPELAWCTSDAGLAIGSSGPSVACVQFVLAANGLYHATLTQKYDRPTAEAMAIFQANHPPLRVDGLGTPADAHRARHLLTVPTANLRRCAWPMLVSDPARSGHPVKCLQDRLVEDGYLQGGRRPDRSTRRPVDALQGVPEGDTATADRRRRRPVDAWRRWASGAARPPCRAGPSCRAHRAGRGRRTRTVPELEPDRRWHSLLRQARACTKAKPTSSPTSSPTTAPTRRRSSGRCTSPRARVAAATPGQPQPATRTTRTARSS